MSLITCCPSCGTMFRVVPDQLRISEGWVRCGHCAEVFDATAHMMDPPPALAAEGPDTLPAGDEAPPPSVPLKARAAASPVPSTTSRAAAGARGAPQPATTGPDSESAPDSRALEESPLDRPFIFRRSDMGEGDDLPSVSPPVAPPGPPPGAAAWAPSSHMDEEVAVHHVTFMKEGLRGAFWRRPFVRGVLAVLFLLSGAALALQWGLHDRNRLAAAYPDLQPVLQQLCDIAGCRLGPPQQIEAIAIESSGFNKLRGEAYRLSFTLRNQAAVPVAVPSMELTLTDSQDQPVLRRVLTPAELGMNAPVIAASGEWTAAVPMAVAHNAGRIAGYRLLAFYP